MSAKAPSDSEPSEAPRTRSRLSRALRLIGVVVALAGGAYVAGRLSANPRIEALELEVRTERENRVQLEAQVADLRVRLSASEGRRLLSLAREAFDRANFGIAQGHLDAAAKLLSSTDENGPLTTTIRALRLAPAGDLDAQRAELQKLIEALDAARADEH